MSQGVAGEVGRLIAGLERLARLANAVPEEVLAAWLYYDAGLSKSQARNVAESIKKLLRILTETKEADGNA